MQLLETEQFTAYGQYIEWLSILECVIPLAAHDAESSGVQTWAPVHGSSEVVSDRFQLDTILKACVCESLYGFTSTRISSRVHNVIKPMKLSASTDSSAISN